MNISNKNDLRSNFLDVSYEKNEKEADLNHSWS